MKVQKHAVTVSIPNNIECTTYLSSYSF